MTETMTPYDTIDPPPSRDSLEGQSIVVPERDETYGSPHVSERGQETLSPTPPWDRVKELGETVSTVIELQSPEEPPQDLSNVASETLPPEGNTVDTESLYRVPATTHDEVGNTEKALVANIGTISSTEVPESNEGLLVEGVEPEDTGAILGESMSNPETWLDGVLGHLKNATKTVASWFGRK